MLGTLIHIVYLVLGFFMASALDNKQPFYIRIWLGLVLGTLGMMWTVVPFAFILKFNIISNLLGLSLFVLITYLLVNNSNKLNEDLVPIVSRKNSKKEPESDTLIAKIKNLINYSWDENATALVCLAIPLVVLIMYIAFNHIIYMKPDGMYSGQSTYGDLPMHLGFITSIAEQGMFPPEYSINPGVRLSYPFLVNSLSSSIYIFGDSLWLSVMFPTFILVVSFVMGFFILAYEIIKNKWASIIATILLFLNGGFGFFYFLEANYINIGDQSQMSVVNSSLVANLKRMVTEWYHTPTNLNELNIRWSNIICDMIIPQRTALAGWAMVILAFWLLYKAITTEQKKFYTAAGICGGLLPMVHTHSFLAFGIVAAVWAVIYLFQSEEIKTTFINWFYFGIPALALSLPQLLFWTFTQTGGDGFLEATKGWLSAGNENQIWFWIKNVGIVMVLLVPALFTARKKMLMIYSGPLAIFIIANFVKFQPNPYDNNKLFYIWYMFTVILVSAYVYSIYQRIRDMKSAWMFLAIILLFGTLSGGLTIAREINSGGEFLQFSKESIEAAEYVKKSSPVDSMFLTSDHHLNPIASLSGRNIVIGTDLYLHWHGVTSQEKKRDINLMFEGKENFENLKNKYKIDYVFISPYEKANNKANVQYFDSTYKKAFSNDEITIYAVSERAVQSIK